MQSNFSSSKETFLKRNRYQLVPRIVYISSFIIFYFTGQGELAQLDQNYRPIGILIFFYT